MKKLFVFLGVVAMTIGSAVSAQEATSMAPLQKSSWGDAKENVDYIPDVRIDTRLGYGHNITGKTGRFGGNGLFLDINGKISPHLSYSLNHRIANSEGNDGLGFDNTNWLLLTYETENFSVSAGKDAIFVGNFEYDSYDLDCYWQMNSIYWNCCNPWQWGVSAAWYPAEDQSLSIQICNSPFSTLEMSGLFAYALAWRGAWDFYESYWTANLWQYGTKDFIGSLNFGNRFHLGDFTFDIEYMTRGTGIRTLFTDDFTLLAAPAYEWDWGRVFGKIGWDRVTNDIMGYEFTGNNVFYGAGIEVFPIKTYKDLRLHAAWGANTSFTGELFLEIGLKWSFNLTDTVKSLLSRAEKK